MKNEITCIDDGLVYVDDGSKGLTVTSPLTTDNKISVYMDMTEYKVKGLEPICTDEEWVSFCEEVGLTNG